MGDDHTYIMDGVGAVLIKMFDGMIRELKDVRYIPKVKKNIISTGALESKDLEFTCRDGVLKVLKSFIVILKGVRCKNLYYLKDNIVAGQLVTSVGIDDD